MTELTLQKIRAALNPENVYAEIMFVDDVGRDTTKGKVYSLHLTDDTTVMKISIWDKNLITNLKKGQKILITKAYVTIFQNEPQLNLAKEGKIEVVSK